MSTKPQEEQSFFETKDINTLESFPGWEETPGSTESFFGIEDENAPVKKPEVPPADGKEEEVVTPVLEEEEVPSFFGEEETTSSIEEAEEITTEEEPTNEEEEEVFITDLEALKLLKAKGLADFELEEGEELTAEKATEILEDSLDEGVEKRVGELLQALPKDLQDLNKFVLEGGDLKDFLGTLVKSNTQSISRGMDLNVEANQIAIIKSKLEAEDHDPEYIEEHIEFLKDTNKLKTISEKAYAKWEEKDNEEKSRVVQEQKTKALQNKENRRKYKAAISEFFSKAEEIDGYTLSKKDKKELPTYMTELTVPNNNGGKMTAMQARLFQAMQNEKEAALLAVILKNDFDFTPIAKKAATTQVKKTKEIVQRSKTTPKISGGAGGSQSKKALFDYF